MKTQSKETVEKFLKIVDVEFDRFLKGRSADEYEAAVHGSCGQLVAGDVVIAISNSGETRELKATVSAVKKNGCKVIGVSGNPNSWLAQNTDVFLFAGVEAEGGSLKRAPRNSVLAELLTLQALPVILQVEKDGILFSMCDVIPGESWESYGEDGK